MNIQISKIQISELRNNADPRGCSFTLPSEAVDFVKHIADVHVASSAPGMVRGNHFHLHKRQAVILFTGTAWSLHFDHGEGTSPEHREFDGSCAVLVLVPPGCSQAVRNDGGGVLWLVTCSSEVYDPATVVARRVV
jgi:dTDP-4-dehydrorhamnose 3,5-epimerase-like enzyme